MEDSIRMLISERVNVAFSTKRLQLQGLGLTSFPLQILILSNTLEYLDLFDNQIEEIPESIGDFTSLNTLCLRKNKIRHLPSRFSRLVRLVSLELQDNNLMELPSHINHLTNLKFLFLQKNDIIKIGTDFTHLQKLITLNLSQNKLQILPESIGELSFLQRLYLDDNFIKIMPENYLKLKLKDFSISNNPIGQLPSELSQKSNINSITYFVRLSNSVKKKLLFEAKVIIVGESSVGKTTLIHRVVENKFESNIETTHGIKVIKWIIKTPQSETFRINFWDFGGQEIYHSTHQFFLTKRSLYLFIWDARKDDNLVSFDYWLNVIRLLGNNPSILVVMNKSDETEKLIDEGMIKKNFPNIAGFYKVSAKNNIKIDDLCREIIENVTNLPHIGEQLPNEWYEVRKRIESKPENFMSYKEFVKICKEHELDETEAKILSDYFHDLGIILNFKDNHTLRDIIFLKPEWATNAVYKLNNNREIINRYGKFTYDDLGAIWEHYPKDKYKYLLELMQKFELTFKLPYEENTYIIPELLRTEKIDYYWDYKDNMQFIFEYSFMPKGILARFIVRNHHKIFSNMFWKNGTILYQTVTETNSQNDSQNVRYLTKGEVTIDILKRRIFVSVKCNGKTFNETVITGELSKPEDAYSEKISRNEYCEIIERKEKLNFEINNLNSEQNSKNGNILAEINLGKIKQHESEIKNIEKKIFHYLECCTQEKLMLSYIKDEISLINETLNKPSIKELVPCICTVCSTSPHPHLFDLEKLKLSKYRGRTHKECENTSEDVLINPLLGYFDEDQKIKFVTSNNSTTTINNSHMKIENINAYTGSTVTIIEKVKELSFIENVGISSSDQDKIKEFMVNSEISTLERLKTLYNDYVIQDSMEQKQVSKSIIVDFIDKNLVPLSQGVASSAIFELLKGYFGAF